MKKLCSLLSLIPLYKNGAGFTDIIHNSAEVICGGVRKKRRTSLKLNHERIMLTNENA